MALASQRSADRGAGAGNHPPRRAARIAARHAPSMPLGALIFAATYVLVSARRLGWLGIDRPAGALIGAVACVVSGALTPTQALGAVDGSTIVLLFAVMGMGAFLAQDGFFASVEPWLIHIAKTPARLIGLIVWSAGTLSALVTNDAVCVLAAPVLVRIIAQNRLPPLPFLLALATAANTGSVATLVGNPQNMLCGILGGLHYRDYLLEMLPVALVGLAINHGAVLWLFRRDLASAQLTSKAERIPVGPHLYVTLAIVLGTAVVLTLGGNLAWTAVAGLATLMLVHRRDTRQLWPRIDWSILLFFAGLFVVVEAFVASGVPARIFAWFPLGASADGTAGWTRVVLVFLVGSNIVSNVPFIMVVRDQMATLPDPQLGWTLLAMASTFAGNLTLLGSVANIIVAEAGRELGGFGFWQYLRLGLPVALLTTAAGTAWLLLV